MGQPAHRALVYHPLMPPRKEPVAIAVAATRREKEKVFRLRYLIYVEEMGKRLTDADNRRRLLYDDMDDWGLLLYARVGREIAGTVRLHCGTEKKFSPDLRTAFAMDRFHSVPPETGDLAQFSFLSKVMIAPQYRNSKVLPMLFDTFYQACRQQSVRVSFVGCGAHLIPLYERFGFRRYKSNFFVPDYGYMIPFANLPEDIGHLRRVNSPLVSGAEKWSNSTAVAAWFAREFPEASHHINRRLAGEDEFLRILLAKLGHAPERSVGLFRGMTSAEASACANVGHLLRCRQADTVVYPEDASDAIYIVVTGSLTVRAQSAGRTAMAVLRPGQAFGAQAYLTCGRQQATVVARTDTELLVLPRHTLERLGRDNSALAAKLLRNIGRQMKKKYA